MCWPSTCSKVNPDEALLAGMMHGIGKLYIMTRAAQHPELFVDNETLDEICGSWHASIGKAILENWEFSDLMATAVGEQDDFSREAEVEPDLRDVIAIAILAWPPTRQISRGCRLASMACRPRFA